MRNRLFVVIVSILLIASGASEAGKKKCEWALENYEKSKSASKEDGIITTEYELTTHVRICTVFILKQENAIKLKVKVVGKIKPGETFGNVRDKNDICEIFRSFEKLVRVTGAKSF